MSDYISKSKLIEELKNTTYVFKHFGRRESVGLGEVVSTIEHQPTLDEKEIIRKAFERVVERLENCVELTFDKSVRGDLNAGQRNLAYHKALKILKEECGINE